MKEDIIWDLRSEGVRNALKTGKRLDGRAFDEYREIKVTKGEYLNADGCARVKIGDTEVIVGVKSILGEPYPDSPDKGTIAVGTELSPIASPIFETGPPRENAIELSRVVDRGLRESKMLDFKDLCVKEGELVFVVFIDGYVTDYSGNLFDTNALAALGALIDAKVPKIEDGKIVKGEYTGPFKILKKPVLSTFAKIGNEIVLDPNLAEEKTMDARISMSITEDSVLAAFQKGGSGSFTKSEIDSMIETAMKKTKDLRKKVE